MKITKKHLLAGVFSVFAISMLVVPAVLAQNMPNLPNSQYAISNLENQQDIMNRIEGIINSILAFLGFIAVIIMLIGGFLWMTAAGNEEKVEKAKKTIGAGVIGLAIILLSWIIVRIVWLILINQW
ncbi:MAG: hypothetical protein PHS07_02945 [Patescibacteria group bacterium]|nr:hypothetical protein [Patescibacteria group bacterium]